MFQFHNIYMSAGLQGLVGSVSLTNGGNYTSPPTSITFSGGGGTGAAASMTIGNGFHTGPVTSISQPYEVHYSYNPTPPTVSFSGGGGTGATASTSVTGVVYTISLTNDGGHYLSGMPAPSVNINGGGGSGATGVANMVYRTVRVGSISIQSSAYYTAAPSVTVTCGYGQVYAASITAVLSNGSYGTITSFTINDGGEYYTSPSSGSWGSMNVVVSGPTSSGSTSASVRTMYPITFKVGSWVMSGAFQVINRGSGYTTAPTVYCTGPAITHATASATIATKLLSINLINGGSGYSSPPTVTLSPAVTTTTCTVDAGTSYYVTSIFMTNMGSGYTSTPTVNIVGGSGSVATAIAKLI